MVKFDWLSSGRSSKSSGRSGWVGQVDGKELFVLGKRFRVTFVFGAGLFVKSMLSVGFGAEVS